jgi:hypothetical protein
MAIFLCCVSFLVASSLMAGAADKKVADKEVVLNLEDIEARVAGYNNTVRIGKLSLTEAQNALR